MGSKNVLELQLNCVQEMGGIASLDFEFLF